MSSFLLLYYAVSSSYICCQKLYFEKKKFFEIIIQVPQFVFKEQPIDLLKLCGRFEHLE